MMRLPPARPAARRLRAVDEVEVHACLGVVVERLECRVDDVEGRTAAIGDGADGEEGAEEDVANGCTGEAIRIGDFLLFAIVGRAAALCPCVLQCAEDSAAEWDIGIGLNADRSLTAVE